MKKHNPVIASLLLFLIEVAVLWLLLDKRPWTLLVWLYLVHYTGLVIISLIIESLNQTKRSPRSLSFTYHLWSFGSLLIITMIAWLLDAIGFVQLLSGMAVAILFAYAHFYVWAQRTVKGVHPDRLFQ